MDLDNKIKQQQAQKDLLKEICYPYDPTDLCEGVNELDEAAIMIDKAFLAEKKARKLEQEAIDETMAGHYHAAFLLQIRAEAIRLAGTIKRKGELKMPSLEKTKKGWDIYDGSHRYCGMVVMDEKTGKIFVTLKGTVSQIHEIVGSAILHTI